MSASCGGTVDPIAQADSEPTPNPTWRAVSPKPRISGTSRVREEGIDRPLTPIIDLGTRAEEPFDNSSVSLQDSHIHRHGAFDPVVDVGAVSEGLPHRGQVALADGDPGDVGALGGGSFVVFESVGHSCLLRGFAGPGAAHRVVDGWTSMSGVAGWSTRKRRKIARTDEILSRTLWIYLPASLLDRIRT